MALAGNQGTTQAADKALKKLKKKPVPKAVKNATAQEQAYASQGQAVEKAANVVKSNTKTINGKVFKFKPTPGGLHKQGQTSGQWVTVDNGKERGMTVREANPKRSKHQATVAAPVLKVLEQTTRPVHAIAGASKAAIEGKNIPKAALRGIENKDKTTFSNVLGAAGVHNKLVKGIVGLAGDIALDPTTYTTFGAGTIAEKAALKVAKDAAKRAEASGMSAAGKETAVRGAVRKVNPEAAKSMKIRHGATEGVKKRAANRAIRSDVKQAVHQTETGPKGLTVKFAGKEVPGVRKATAKASVPIRKIPVPGRKGLRIVGHEFRPSIRPSKQIPIAEYQAVRHAKSMGRAVRHMHERQGEEQAINLTTKAKHSSGEWDAIFAAVEKGPRNVRKFRQANPELGKTAQDVQAHYKGQLRLRRQAGSQTGVVGRKRLTEDERRLQRLAGQTGRPNDVLAAMKRVEKAVEERQRRSGEAHGYVPHMLISKIEQGKGGVEALPSSRAPGTTKFRAGREPISTLNPIRAAKGKGEFSTAGPLVHQNYAIQTGATLGRLKTVEGLKQAGRELKAKTVVTVRKDGTKKVTREWQTPAMKEGDAIYEISKKGGVYDVRKVDKPKGIKSKGIKSKRPVQYVVLNEQNATRILKPTPTIQGTLMEHGGLGVKGSATIGAYDKATRGFKIAATGTPGFHVRNLIGDTHMHYNVAPGHKMPSNYKKAWKVVAFQSKAELKKKIGLPSYQSNEAVVVGGRRIPIADYAKELETHGISRGGRRAVDVKLTTQELEGLSGVTKAAGRSRATKARISRWMQNREDLSRVATYTHFRDMGKTPAEAARLVHEGPHPDYADLSFIEKEFARRGMPFYTFSARSVPFHVKTLVQRPGKIANFEKIREEAQQVAGGGSADLGSSLYTQRQLPVLVKSGGNKFEVQWSDPMNVLNELPTTLNPVEYGKELANYGMGLVTPLVKDPIEYFNNYSFFFRSQIEPDNSPLTRAPEFVKKIPADLRHDLRIQQSKSGQWMWPKKLDYLSKTIPGLAQQAVGVTQKGGAASTESKIASLATGIRSTKYDPKMVKLNALYATDNEILKRMAELRKLGYNADTPNKEYSELLLKERAVSHEINSVSGGAYKKNSARQGRTKQLPALAGGGSAGHLPNLSDGGSGGLPDLR